VTDPGPEAGRIRREMRLRPGRAPVTRLSRKVLIGLGIAGAGAVSAALFFALAPQRSMIGSELHNVGSAPAPEGLASLPRDYTGLPHQVPKLGPPLPGDLGKPIDRQCRRAGTADGVGLPCTRRGSRPQEPALRSDELHASAGLGRAGRSWPRAPARPAAASAPAPKDPKLTFLDSPADRRTVSPDSVELPASPYVLQAGSVIPAALITGIRSDLPGEVTAQVTEDVYDSPTGKVLLVPQGARLIGQYDSQVSFGQSRVLLVWTRLVMPNGRSIVLERQPAADPTGYAGLEDGVDNHWGMLFKAAILWTLLSIGSEAGTTNNNQNSLVQAIRQGSSQGFNQVGEQVVGRSLAVQPTLTIRPGFPVRVMVTRDLVLEPYRG